MRLEIGTWAVYDTQVMPVLQQLWIPIMYYKVNLQILLIYTYMSWQRTFYQGVSPCKIIIDNNKKITTKTKLVL